MSSLGVAVVCFPSFGGSGVIAADLAVGLAGRGHRVHLLASAPPSRPLPASERLRFQRVEVPAYPLLEHAPYDLAMASAIAELGERETLDVVHVHYAVPHAVSAHLARELLGARAPRLVVTLHGTDVTHVGSHPSYRPVTRFALERAGALTVPSAYLRGEVYARLGLHESTPIAVIPNFVDTARFAPAERKDPARLASLFGEGASGPVLFHVSNLRPVKRVPELIEVLARVRRRVPARLVIVGDGPERERALGRAVALGVQGSVHFLGNRDDFAAELQHADAFVLTSDSESFGLAALEALSAGVPVVAYGTGGLPELVTPEVGRLVPVGDVAALAEAIVELTSSRERQARLAQAARQRVLSHFRPEPALERYEACYERALAARGRA